MALFPSDVSHICADAPATPFPPPPYTLPGGFTTDNPIVVDFPLRGQWFAPNTPGKRVPSHGTDVLGERYAYDFMGLAPDLTKMKCFRQSVLCYFLLGARLSDYYGWGQPIYSATDGVVVTAADGCPERDPVLLLRDLGVLLKNSANFNARKTPDLRALTGNYITINAGGFYAVYCHGQTGSIKVRAGERVTAGQHIANVGHSGNSTGPHLHFQLMEDIDPWKSIGLPCCFREYEVYREGAWHTVRAGIPGPTERIRK